MGSWVWHVKEAHDAKSCHGCGAYVPMVEVPSGAPQSRSKRRSPSDTHDPPSVGTVEHMSDQSDHPEEQQSDHQGTSLETDTSQDIRVDEPGMKPVPPSDEKEDEGEG